MDEALNKAVQEIMSILLTLVATVFIPYGAMLAREWVKARIARLQDANMREGMRFAFERLEATATTVVAEIEQTIRRKIEGKFADPQGLLAAAEKATRERLPPEALKTLCDGFGEDGLNRIITGKIEAKVAKMNCIGC
jgi:hypothetical protein